MHALVDGLDAGLLRRWSARLALTAGLAALLFALMPSVGAQGQPPPPHWFFGTNFAAHIGASITAFDEGGNAVASNSAGSGVVDASGEWFVVVSSDDANQVRLQLVSGDTTLETGLMDVSAGDLTQVPLSAFRAVEATTPVEPDEPDEQDEPEETMEDLEGPAAITVRIVARRAEDGRIEFGMRDPNGEEIFPRARFFPIEISHGRWLSSSEIDFGDGFLGRIIARRNLDDGRTEFGFRVEGYDDIFPRARFFPASGPDHNRFLVSSEIEINQPQ